MLNASWLGAGGETANERTFWYTHPISHTEAHHEHYTSTRFCSTLTRLPLLALPPAWVEEWLPILVRAPHLSPLLLLLLPVPVPAALANCAAQARALAPSTASVSLVAAHRAVRSR